MKSKKIVVMGGGSGTNPLLLGLKEYPLDITAIVTMADDGGSTGVLRDELGVLPPGDARQAMTALSGAHPVLRELMRYRFSEGGLRGHNFGNLLLAALEKVTGRFDDAVRVASELLRVQGSVVPVTLDNVRLVAHTHVGDVVRGQAKIFSADMMDYKKLFLEPRATANLTALAAIRAADVIVVGPGDVYSSLIPNFLVKGIPEAIIKSKAKKIYICNLMNRPMQTDDFTVPMFAAKMELYFGCAFDHVIYNNVRAPMSLIERYKRQGEHPVPTVIDRSFLKQFPNKYVGASLIDRKITMVRKAHDAIPRTLIRHNPKQLAKVIVKLLRGR